jgi:hypothetical protein
MTAKNAGASIGPPCPENEKAALAGGSLNTQRYYTAKVVASAESAKQEADFRILQWLRSGGVDYYRRLAHVAADAARKGAA